jgi:hypothetical protein
MLEANRFWFYSLGFSIVFGLMQLLSWGNEDRPVDGAGKRESSASEKASGFGKKGPVIGSRLVARRLLTDVCDLFIPGHITGWIYTSPAFVGFASMVSTLLASKEIWDRLR